MMVLLPEKSHGRRSLVGSSPWGREELGTNKRLHFHFSLSCIGEGNGNLLQCSCLENPRDGGAWWAAIYAVAQSWTRLKWLSSSSSSNVCYCIPANPRYCCFGKQKQKGSSCVEGRFTFLLLPVEWTIVFFIWSSLGKSILLSCLVLVFSSLHCWYRENSSCWCCCCC